MRTYLRSRRKLRHIIVELEKQLEAARGEKDALERLYKELRAAYKAR